MEKYRLYISIALSLILVVAIVFLFKYFRQDEKGEVMTGQQEEISTNSASPSGQINRKFDKFPGVLTDDELASASAVISTEKGDIKIEFYPQDAPKAVSNFIFLAKQGFYNGLTFHRREEAFVIQGGDPNGNGTGGPGYQFEDEPVTKNYDRGIVAMANSGQNTNGSQFFIMLEDNPLPKQYTIFGKVTDGMDVVDNIQIGDVMTKVVIN